MDIRIKTYKSKKGFLKEMRYTLQYVGNHNIANANSDLKCYYADCESKIPMIPQVAKQNREHIKGMVICNIIPIYDFGYYLKEDDLSHYKPGTEIDRKFEVSVRPIGIWIYNESTGEIYKKISYGN